MDKFKQIVKENIVWIVILVALLLALSGYLIYNNLRQEEIYEDPMMSDEKIPLINYTYEDNEYRVITVEKSDVFNSYYKDFINKAIKNTKESWNLVNDEEKKERFNNKYEEYEKFIKSLLTVKSSTNRVEKYKVSGNTITVIDSAHYMFEFEEKGVWNYKVSFKGQVNE